MTISALTYLLCWGPLEVVDCAIEAHFVANVWPGNLPRVAVLQPDVWNLLLEALVQCLQ